jgi:DNA/RNA-binding domain of Phe-tRNA-synthetase-like protein
MELQVHYELEGWQLFAADLERTGDDDVAGLAALRQRVAEWVREEYRLAELAVHPTVAALRKLFRSAGTDPTRYRPSSEALLRRLLKGDQIPAIHPFVDVNNCLSARLAVPACVMAEGTFEGPFELRSGAAGESYDSLRGPFGLEGRPLLVDTRGPCDSPITGSQRVKVTPDTRRATLVAYLPRDAVALETARGELEALVEATTAVRLGPTERPAD